MSGIYIPPSVSETTGIFLLAEVIARRTIFFLLCLQQWSFHYIDTSAMQDVMHFPNVSSKRRKTRSHTLTTSGQSIRLSDGGGCRCIVHACVCGPYRERRSGERHMFSL